MKLKDKYAVVTGASTGIGRAIAVQLAKQGAFTALTARTKPALEETKRLVEKNGGRADIIPCDLGNIYALGGLTETIQINTEQVDILVNVAGIWHGKNEVFANRDFEKFTPQTIIDTYMVGTVSPTLLAHAFIPLMPRGGKIINISGTFENGAKGWLPYYVSKRAIEDLTVGLAQELKDKNIQVNAISPSDTATEQYRKYFPQYIDEAMDPREIAKFAIQLCSSEFADVTGKVFVLKKGKQPFEGFHS